MSNGKTIGIVFVSCVTAMVIVFFTAFNINDVKNIFKDENNTYSLEEYVIIDKQSSIKEKEIYELELLGKDVQFHVEVDKDQYLNLNKGVKVGLAENTSGDYIIIPNS